MEDKSEMRLMSDLESELDIEIFKKFVTPYYQPSNKPLVMCVGAQSPDEGTAIRRFHTQQYRIKGNDVKVAACNIRDGIGSMLQRLNSYDSFIFNHFAGDARTNFPYLIAISEMGENEERNEFDFVYIRNPDLIGLKDWAAIYSTALEMTSKEGVVVTLIRKEDNKEYSDLLEMLNDWQIKPVFSGETGISLKFDILFFEDFHHTIGIFKSNKKE